MTLLQMLWLLFLLTTAEESTRSNSDIRRKPELSLTNMCVIVDGIDQAKTNLPYTKVIAKSTSSLYTVQ